MFIKRLLLIFFAGCTIVRGQEPEYDQVFFSNSRMPGNYFYSHASYQSPSWIKNIKNKLPVDAAHFFTPGNSLELQYTNGRQGKWNAVIRRPEWRGQDFIKKGNTLFIRMLVSSGTTLGNELPAVQLAKKDSIYSRAISLASYMQNITVNSWNTIAISLEDFGNVNFSKPAEIIYINFMQNSIDGKEHMIYVDDIEILPATQKTLSANTPVITNVKSYSQHIDLEWPPVEDSSVKYIKIYRSYDGKAFLPAAIQIPSIHRYADYIGETEKSIYYQISFVGHDFTESRLSPVVSAKTRHMTDEEILTMVQEACFRFYWEGAEKQSGLSKENMPGRRNMIATGASGFGMMALIAGTERRFITRDESVDRFLQIVHFLERTETFHGAFSHFVDGPTKKVEPFFGKRDNGGDLVETSFLIQGLLAARSYFDKEDPKEKQIRDKITNIWEKVEWDWYRKEPRNNFLIWHWSPDQHWVMNHPLIGWNETMITYLLAIASPTHAVPASMYYTGWASLDSRARNYRKSWGHTEDGSLYKNGNTYFGITLPVGVSNGGPLFFTQYSYLGYDPHKLEDAYTNYFENNRNIALINHRYCVENPGKYKAYSDSCWGLSAGDGPFNYSASEPVLRMDDGKIVPTGAIASFPYTPDQSMKALKNLYNNYGHFLWGEYGFRDAFNLTQNWCSEIYMGLNQAPMVVMIENHRTGLLWNLFMKIPDVQNGLKKLAVEKPSTKK